jgi:hypothetical protein
MYTGLYAIMRRGAALRVLRWRAALLAGLVGGVTGCGEPVYVYHEDAFYQVDPQLIGYREQGAWPVPVPAPAFVAVGADDRVVLAGGRQAVVLDARGEVQQRFAWQEAPASAIAVAPDGTIFVGAGDRVVACRPDSAAQAWESLGEQARITGLAAGSNQLWICDAAQRLVWRLDHAGRLLGRIPAAAGTREPPFVVPSPCFAAVATTQDEFWVVNPGRLQLQRHAADGRLLSSWARPGMLTPGFSGCCNPAYLGILPNGDLLTSEGKISRVKVYSPDGILRCVVVPPAALPGEAARPVAADCAGRVFVLDGARLRLFVPVGRLPAPATTTP